LLHQEFAAMNPSAFNFTGLPMRVVFGTGTLKQLNEEVRRLNGSRALLLCMPYQTVYVQAVAAQLGDLCAGIFDQATMHTPVDVTEHAVQKAIDLKADCLIGLGGGSTTGLSKAIALRTDLPQIVMPTTYAGSEATPVVGQAQDGRKTTLHSMKVLPEVIIYDVEQTLTLPVDISVVSGMNAIAHAVEALYAQNANPLTSMLAVEGIRAFSQALPVIVEHPGDIDARAQALYGAWLCGLCLSQVGMALHHKLCHTLGGSFNLPHAQTHTVVLPHATAYNANAAPKSMQQIAQALHVDNAAQGLFDLAQRLGAPTSLQALGMSADDISRAADIAVQNPYWNPHPIDREAIQALLTDAYYGKRPTQ
jgi:maleylacetate reductase